MTENAALIKATFTFDRQSLLVSTWHSPVHAHFKLPNNERCHRRWKEARIRKETYFN